MRGETFVPARVQFPPAAALGDSCLGIAPARSEAAPLPPVKRAVAGSVLTPRFSNQPADARKITNAAKHPAEKEMCAGTGAAVPAHACSHAPAPASLRGGSRGVDELLSTGADNPGFGVGCCAQRSA